MSRSRSGALTLVIDPANGTPNRVACATSRTQALDGAIVALQAREGTTRANIGFIDLSSGRYRSRHPTSIDTIRPWATERSFDAVIWTDLPANFADQTGIEFTIRGAAAYLEELGPNAKEIAYSYIRRAPAFIQTPLRSALHL